MASFDRVVAPCSGILRIFVCGTYGRRMGLINPGATFDLAEPWLEVK